MGPYLPFCGATSPVVKTLAIKPPVVVINDQFPDRVVGIRELRGYFGSA